jgi:outer membrane lipoprotein-sorting protein
MNIKGIWVVIVVSVVSTNVFAKDITPREIFEKVQTKYNSIQTYKSQGIITSDVDVNGMKMKIETSFSIVLKKPNQYLITWDQKNMPMPGMVQSGAVWSDGTQPYLYMGVLNAYSKMDSDKLALASATGISGGAAYTIPSLFFAAFKEQQSPFSRLRNPSIEKTEKIGNEDCYVISGSSSISKEETFWISKSRFLIIKYSRSLEPSEGGTVVPKMTDEQLEESLKATGQKVTEENKRKMREAIARSKDIQKTTQMKGSSTELHTSISSPDLSAKAFQFALPASAVLKDSLFGSAFGGNK